MEWGFNDRPELPPEAGNTGSSKFDPDDEWLKNASEELQIEAMRQWFYARFEDPANCTPYDGGEGGYIFVHGGPHDPDEEIQDRFSNVVDYEVMEKLINDLRQECGDAWAPIDHGDWDYEDVYSMLPDNRTDPKSMLDQRLDQIEATLGAATGSTGFINQLLHSATITALEAYLWDTTAYWVTGNKNVLRSFVEGNRDFSTEKLSITEVFKAMDGIESKVIEYLQHFIWHRLDKVKPLLESTLRIKFPKIDGFMAQINIRHDIVHRGGRDKEGYPVNVSADEVRILSAMVRKFGEEMEVELLRVYPDEQKDPLHGILGAPF